MCPFDKFEVAVQLATVGRIIHQPALVSEGLDAADALLQAGNYLQSNVNETWLYEERLANRLPGAITTIADQLKQVHGVGNFSPQMQPSLLPGIAEAYYFTNRPADVLAMFDLFPQWDIKDIVESPDTYIEKGQPPKANQIAWALAKTGRKDDAARVLDSVLEQHAGFDPAYALLLELKADPIAKLDALFAQDRFEERPLVWKAVVLLKAGKLDEAEKVCRAAIAIDPSDGEEPKGDRMRVYSVLADVLQAKGNAKDAEFFRQVVKAIRLAEDADDAWECNLLSRAVTMYGDALTHFEDAYCIQSRMAVQLAELGRFDEAEAHYQKAYELMPESFGRVESHCFGCEGAFRGSRAQGIAERVFMKLMDKNPKMPQLHYLLGYLRVEQDRWPEALTNFSEAVALDPDYLNAWKKVAECDEHVELTDQVRENAALAILRLDPMGRHGDPDVVRFRDLAKLWQAADTAMRLRYAPPAVLYPLAASAAALQAGANNVGPIQGSNYWNYGEKVATPGALLLRVGRVNQMELLLNYNN